MMDKYLHFSASTSVKNLFGQGLVTDQVAAVFELVKNSYDADARVVDIIFDGLDTENSTLTIKDNGSGMSLDDIQNKWMIIGTDSKKKELYSPIFKRPLNGDKGIGRFSVDRLGGFLHMASIKQGEKILTTADFDWSEFEGESKNIESIRIPYRQKNIDGSSKGVKLVISDLRDIWGADKINNLYRNLRQFKSPLTIDDNFKIFITAKKYGYNQREVVVERLEGVSSLWIEAEITKENPDMIYTTVNKDGIEYESVIQNSYSFGSVRAQVYFFDRGDKIRFNNRYGLRVREYGNIRLFRDDFRVYPYGEEKNDWLDIDRRMAQGFSRFFGSRDLIGYVQTSKADNIGLKPLTSRQGLEENNDFDQLRHFIVHVCIKTLEKYFFEMFKKNVNETISISKKEISHAIENLDDIIKEIRIEDPETANKIQNFTQTIKKEQKNQFEYIKEQQELVKVYTRIAQKETFLHKLIHQSLMEVKDAKSAIENLSLSLKNLSDKEKNKFSIADKYLQDAIDLLSRVRDDVVKKRQKRTINLTEEIEKYFREIDASLIKSKIEAILKLDQDVKYYMDVGDFKAILNNLTTNAIKSLNKVSDRPRKIIAELHKTDKFIIFKLIDNGIGIDEMEREKIFDPFHSTTDGFGLGLTIVDETLREYNGHLELMATNEPGACFTFKMR